MRPADELTLYAYGLLEESEEEGLESHLKTCATCGESVRLLKIEHRVVTQAAARGETPAVPAPFPSVRPSRYGAPLLVAGLAAAALLGILVWLLLHPFRGGDGSGGAGYAQGSGDDLDRLIAELKSPSTVRREIAELALRAHGRGAVEKLENAKADPALIEACRGITREDAATLKKLMETRITLDLENTPLPALLDQMREISQLNFNLSGIPNADEERVSFKVNDIVLDGALRLLLHPRGCAYRVKNGAVLVTTEALAKTLDGSTAPAQNPVRFAVEEEVVARAAAALSSESPEERDRASESLVRLGFAAEPALWKALDSPRAEERGRASDLLRQLYSTLERPPRSGTARTLRESKVDLAFENARYSDILAFLGQRLQIPIVGVTPLDLNLKTTVVIKDLIAENSLKLILSQTGQNYLLVDGMILIADSGQRL
ncbi:MAG TPA: hypothetical protein VEN81_04295, partial [Planctomycetota bacterium]|nr:hypothetical protein [Planctomycetota bacterium]